MKILFIGGTGVLSTDIVKLAIKQKHEVFLLNRGTHVEDIPAESHLIIGNIRDTISCKKELSNYKFDVVADFLSYTPEQLKSAIDIIQDICTQYIFVSSACSYRRDSTDFPIKENSVQPNTNLPYGISKYECEKLLKSLNWKFKYTIVRPYITYGDTRIPYGIAPAARYHGTIIARILSGKPMFYWNENGHIPVCNLTHTRDFAVAFCGLFLNPLAYDEDFNIVGDETYSWKTMVETLYEVLEMQNKNIINIPVQEIIDVFTTERDFFKGDRNLDAVFDNTKIKNAVPEFKTTISLKEGILMTVNHYKTHNYLSGIDYCYDALCDRLLNKHQNGIYFKDYLHNASLIQKIRYCVHRYLSDKEKRLLSKIKKAITK